MNRVTEAAQENKNYPQTDQDALRIFRKIVTGTGVNLAVALCVFGLAYWIAGYLHGVATGIFWVGLAALLIQALYFLVGTVPLLFLPLIWAIGRMPKSERTPGMRWIAAAGVVRLLGLLVVCVLLYVLHRRVV